MSRIISLYPVRIPRITYFNTNSFLVSTLVRFEYFSILRIYEYILIRVIRVICVRLNNLLNLRDLHGHMFVGRYLFAG